MGESKEIRIALIELKSEAELKTDNNNGKNSGRKIFTDKIEKVDLSKSTGESVRDSILVQSSKGKIVFDKPNNMSYLDKIKNFYDCIIIPFKGESEIVNSEKDKRTTQKSEKEIESENLFKKKISEIKDICKKIDEKDNTVLVICLLIKESNSLTKRELNFQKNFGKVVELMNGNNTKPFIESLHDKIKKNRDFVLGKLNQENKSTFIICSACKKYIPLVSFYPKLNELYVKIICKCKKNKPYYQTWGKFKDEITKYPSVLKMCSNHKDEYFGENYCLQCKKWLCSFCCKGRKGDYYYQDIQPHDKEHILTKVEIKIDNICEKHKKPFISLKEDTEYQCEDCEKDEAATPISVIKIEAKRANYKTVLNEKIDSLLDKLKKTTKDKRNPNFLLSQKCFNDFYAINYQLYFDFAESKIMDINMKKNYWNFFYFVHHFEIDENYDNNTELHNYPFYSFDCKGIVPIKEETRLLSELKKSSLISIKDNIFIIDNQLNQLTEKKEKKESSLVFNQSFKNLESEITSLCKINENMFAFTALKKKNDMRKRLEISVYNTTTKSVQVIHEFEHQNLTTFGSLAYLKNESLNAYDDGGIYYHRFLLSIIGKDINEEKKVILANIVVLSFSKEFNKKEEKHMKNIGLYASPLFHLMDNYYLFEVGQFDKIEIWDILKSENITKYENIKFYDNTYEPLVSCVTALETCAFACGCQDGNVHVWVYGYNNFEDARVPFLNRQIFKAHDTRIGAIHFSKEKKIVTWGYDNKIKIFDRYSFEMILCFTPDIDLKASTFKVENNIIDYPAVILQISSRYIFIKKNGFKDRDKIDAVIYLINPLEKSKVLNN